MTPESKELEEMIRGADPATYGENYQSHALELFKLYLAGTEGISAKRQTANAFFVTLNSAIIGFVGYVESADLMARDEIWFSLVSVAGAVLSYFWYRMVRSYRSINSAKFAVINAVEKSLPLRLYDAEWELVGRGKDARKHLPFTKVEMAVPWVFFALHSAVLIQVFGGELREALACVASAA